MPPKVKITREMILQAAFGIVRSEGHEALNARRIAERLKCSTQPVLYSFKTVDEIRTEVYKVADEFHTKYIMPQDDSTGNPLLALGLNYIRFGHEEKHLFRFLFQTNMLGTDVKSLFDAPQLDMIISIVAGAMQTDRETARQSFMTFFAVAHGFASLLANNAMNYDEEQLKRSLEVVFRSCMTGKG